jgi:hypothetical protein
MTETEISALLAQFFELLVQAEASSTFESNSAWLRSTARN